MDIPSLGVKLGLRRLILRIDGTYREKVPVGLLVQNKRQRVVVRTSWGCSWKRPQREEGPLSSTRGKSRR